MNLNLKKVKIIHFVGIKGVAMTALAIIAKEMGMRVTGSDVEETFPTDATLKRFNLDAKIGFKAENIPDQTDLVIYTGAHQGSKNPEVQAAQASGIQTLSHGEALGLFMQLKKGISVAGSHGKTTSTAMLASVLINVGKDPSFALGSGEITHLKTPAHAGQGEWFVAEADEYVTDPTADLKPRFLWQKPELLLITNIDYDHPDVYQDLNAVKKAFADFSKNIVNGGKLIVNIDDEPSKDIVSQVKAGVITYGKNRGADFQLIGMNMVNGKTEFKVRHRQITESFILSIPGGHNALNATGVVATLIQLGLTSQEIARGLAEFSGTKRRFELVGQKNGKLVYDDYAHHPAEIKATLLAVKAWFPDRRVIVIFQPHTYSRTKALLSEFSESFRLADKVVLTEIYASARETSDPLVSGRVLYEKVKEHQKEVYFAPQKTDVLQYLRLNIRQNDLILTMGAGSIYTWLGDILLTL